MRIYYKLLGLTSLVLGGIGAVLPLMPTTCFVLFAAWCFSKSSPKWKEKLERSYFFGSILTNWEENRCIPTKSKYIAVLTMLVSGVISLVIIQSNLGKVAVLLAISIGIFSLFTVKACPVREI